MILLQPAVDQISPNRLLSAVMSQYLVRLILQTALKSLFSWVTFRQRVKMKEEGKGLKRAKKKTKNTNAILKKHPTDPILEWCLFYGARESLFPVSQRFVGEVDGILCSPYPPRCVLGAD